MGMVARLLGRESDNQTLDLVDALKGHSIIEITDDGAILAQEHDEPRPQAGGKQIKPAINEFTATLLQDSNPQFANKQTELSTYREMRNDASIRNSLLIHKTPILAATWFMESASHEQSDVDISTEIWKNLTDGMSNSFPQTVVEALNFIDYGVYAFEKVWDIVDGKVVLKKLVPIHPLEIDEPEYDSQGGYSAILVQTERDPVPIPIEKLLVFTYDREAGVLWGRSLLRSAFKHWHMKEVLTKIDAIQKERHGTGVPVIKLPANPTEEDKRIARQIGQNIRTNEQAYIIKPYNFEIEFAELKMQTVNVVESIQYHRQMIYENVMANFLVDVEHSSVNYRENLFLKGARFTADIMLDVFNKYLIPQLVHWNYGDVPNGYPKLNIRRLGDTTDWRAMSFAIRNLVGAGIISPTEDDEHWFRNEMDMVKFNPTAVREVEAPQQPNTSGTPRQSQAANQRSDTGNPSRVGRDGSGG